jgi:hypothetical protein
LAAMIVIVILSFAAAGILDYSLTTYRNSKRQAFLDQAREVADSEMQYLYYQWKNAILTHAAASGQPIVGYLESNPTTSTIASPSVIASPSGITTNLTPFTSVAQGFWQGGTWAVSRAIAFNNKYVAGSSTTDGSATGVLAGSGGQVGKIYYYTALTTATYKNPVLGSVTFHSGRNFQYSSASLFRYALFYQGNLEISAGGDMVINGPISTNASAYLGSQTGYNLVLSDNIFYFQDYNGASDPLSGETDRFQGNGALTDPIYNPNPDAAAPAAGAPQAAQRAIQVHNLTQQQSFTGGVDVASAIANYQNAYVNPNSQLVDPNEVYRAVIAPPPVVQSGITYPQTTPGPVGTPIPEDPGVAASRMYNSAGIVITINQNAAGAINVQVGYANDATHEDDTQSNLGAFYNGDPAGNGSGVLKNYISSIFANSATTGAVGVRATGVVDMREKANGVPSVNLTTLDVAQLNNALATVMPTQTSSGQIGATYNGVVYIQDTTTPANNTLANGGVSGTLNAILLKNGAQTPNFNDSSGNPLGFTVVSNNGVYVQGDYNTQTIQVNGSPVPNPTSIMGDAITAVSTAWTPTAAYTSAPIYTGGNPTGRQAQPTTYPIVAPPVGVAGETNANVNSIGLSQVTAISSYIDASPGVGMTINSAILTGNTPSTTGSGSYNSGGAQNLVRMEEDWFDNGLTMNLIGSLGQLFTSDYFTGPYRGNASLASIGGDNIYEQPTTRNVVYDTNFSTRTPAGTPATTTFQIGPFFTW